MRVTPRGSNPPPPSSTKPSPPPNPPALAGGEKKGDVVRDLEARANEFAVVAVADPEAFQRGADNLRELKTLQDTVAKELAKATKPLNEALKTVRGWFSGITEKLQVAERQQRKALADYKTEQDRLEAEARRKREAEARAERERLEAEARAREQAARAAAEEERRKAEAARELGDEAAAERLEAKASTIETKAEATADNLRARAETVVAAPVATAAPAAKGLASRVVWKVEVLDPALIPPAFLAPDLAKIDKMVKALKADAAAVLGGDKAVRVWSEQDFSARRK